MVKNIQLKILQYWGDRMRKQYYPLVLVPEGTEMIVKKTGEKVKLVKKSFFPLRFLCDDGNIYFTYDVDIVGWPPNDG